MIQRLFYNFSILCLIFGCLSCIRTEDFKNPKLNSSWDPSLAIPLVSSKVTLADAVNGADTSNIFINSEGYYTIQYKDTVFTLPANDIVVFPDQNFASNTRVPSAPIAILPVGSSLTISSTTSIPIVFTTTGATLNYLDISSGTLALDFTSEFKQDLSLTVQFNGLTKNGVTLVKQYDLAYTGSVPVSATDAIDLSNYTLSPTNNAITLNLTMNVKGTGNSIATSEKLNVSGKLTSLKYSKWVGNPGTFEIPVPEGKVQVGVFNQAIPKADVGLVKPKLTVSFINSFGIPSSFGITKLYSTTAYDATFLNPITTSAFLPNVANGISWSGYTSILYPTNSNSSNSVTTTYEIDNTNSNIPSIINPAPKNIYYGTKLKVEGSSNTNYIRSDSKLSVFTKIELPLYGHISAYNLVDTFNITLPTQDNVKQATMRLFTDNSIPVKMNLQAYFLDSLNNPVDSLVTFSTTTVPGFSADEATGAIVAEPAIYDSNGNLVSNVALFKDFIYPYARYARISKCKKMILKGNIVSSKVLGIPNYNFKITPQMTMTVKMSMKVDLTFKP